MQHLNEQQQQAVTTTEGKVRVVAGAGSGKTTVLAHRYAYLVNELGIAPGNIVSLTFTNKAAAEMRQRISRLTGKGNVNDFICTIHGFCAKFLRTEIFRIGYPKNFIIIDESDGKTLASQAMQEFGIDRRKTTANRFLEQVGKIKGADADGYIRKYLLPNSTHDAPDAVTRYMKLQLKQYALDYDDLLYFTLYILKNFPEVRQTWTKRLNYIMVDEAQDCSEDDWQLINMLASHHANLFIVGDPDQAIYQWRGASPQLFIDFNAECTIIMNINYRSTPQILAPANSIIANNKSRIPKDLYTNNPGGLLPEHHHSSSQRDEAESIAKNILTEVTDNGRRYSEIAVLYRSSYISSELEYALVQSKIPYTIWGGAKFMERKEIKDIMSYLRVIDSDDDISLERIINVPSRKFGKASLEKLTTLAKQESRSLYNTLSAHSHERPYNSTAIRQFVSLIDECRSRRIEMPVSEIADYVLTESGYTDMLRNDNDEERLENLAELINQMKEFERTRGDEDAVVTSLTQYLQDMALYAHENDENKADDAVRLMTIHQSKGLEFPVVFIAGLTEGTFPSHRTIRERRDQGEEEERRLMYVAVTRAMQRLFLSESEGFINENGALKFPSRFLYEIPEEQVLRFGVKNEQTLFSGTKMVVDRLNSEVYGTSETPFKIGDIVTHKIFGEGKILSHDKESDSYTVEFKSCVRNLMPRVLTKK